MTDKQIKIDELKNEIACKENIINHLAEHNIKLQVQFKEKEQECEYWKHQAELGLDTTDNLVKELEEKEQECERLKETFDGLFKVQYKLADNNKKLRQCLTEIKEIAEHCIKQDICATCDYSDKCHIEDEEIPTYDVCKLILQKISKYEGNNG